jgi:hypothetical protein
MFQPQPTPYASSFSYGVPGSGSELADFSFPPTSLISPSGSSSLLYTSSSAHFSPLAHSASPTGTNPHTHSSFEDSTVKMETTDTTAQDELAAQEAAARDYQPDLEVCLFTTADFEPDPSLVVVELCRY